VIRTRALKVVTVDEDAEVVLDGLIESLTRTPPEFKYSTTVDFKLIPFKNNAINGEGLTELFARHNNYLHSTMATSVVDGGDCRQTIENKRNSIVGICMNATSSDGMFLFDSAEPGRRNQCNFLHPKHLQGEAEAFLDNLLDHLLRSYGADYCRSIFGGDEHVRREN